MDEYPTISNFANNSCTYKAGDFSSGLTSAGTAHFYSPMSYGEVSDSLKRFQAAQACVLSQPIRKEESMVKEGTKRLVRVFIADTDENLSLEQAIIYKSDETLTDLTDQELFMEIGIKDILAKHNEVRAKTIDKKASIKAGRDIYLEPARIRDLKMVVSNIAEF